VNPAANSPAFDRPDLIKNSALAFSSHRTVGQRLSNFSPIIRGFELTEVAASERSSGKKYSEAVNWHLNTSIPSQPRI